MGLASVAGEVAHPPRSTARLRRLLARARNGWIPTASIVGGLVLWQLIGQFAVQNSLFLATPLQAFGAIVELAVEGQLWRDASVSAYEFALGYALAAVAGILVGVAMASSRMLNGVLSPWVSGLYATPTIALAPLLILWFGIGPASKVAVVFILVIFPVIINTEAGIRSTDGDLIEASVAFGANRREVFQKVSLPYAMPYILTGLRLGIGRGLIAVVVGEMFGARAGLGFLINNSAQVFNMPKLFAGIILIAAAGIVMTYGFRRLERRIVHWQR